jgi:hypothetical protein
MAAILGTLHERTNGDATNARRWYESALRLNPEDKAALRGLNRLEVAEAVSRRKALEVERAKELEQSLGQGTNRVAEN